MGNPQSDRAQRVQGISIVSFLTALSGALAVFVVQVFLFLLLRNKLARIFKPKTYLVPPRERTGSPPPAFLKLILRLWNFSDRELIRKCGLDAFFFLRYLKTLLVIFIPMSAIMMPVLISVNYFHGKSHKINESHEDTSGRNNSEVTGLDTLAWGNVSPNHTAWYAVHLVVAVLVIIWVCTVFYLELRVYIKVRQDYLTSAEHRLKASATTVLISSIPAKWLTEEALRGLFDVFPGGVRNIWLNRDLSWLLQKISQRNQVHLKLEAAETSLIKAATRAENKRRDAKEAKTRKCIATRAMEKKERAARNVRRDEEAQRIANDIKSTGPEEREDFSQRDAKRLKQWYGISDSLFATTRQRLEELMNPSVQYGSEQTRDDTEHSQVGFEHRKILSTTRSPQQISRFRQGIQETVRNAGSEVDRALKITNGFVPTSSGDDFGHRNDYYTSVETGSIPKGLRRNMIRENTVRTLDAGDTYDTQETKWWQFWKPPSGSYVSPVPQGTCSAVPVSKDSYSITNKDKEESVPIQEYTQNYEEGAVWKKYLQKTDRPTHRLPLFGKTWLPGIPLLSRKVDTIFQCREELDKLNREIEEAQGAPERFPLMNSAFVQFNQQAAAHMACQSEIHHVPQTMAPRIIEIAPKDVIWENMAFTWWKEWQRKVIVTVILLIAVSLWAIPVAWTAALSQVGEIIQESELLSSLKESETLKNAARAIAGVLPTIILALVLFLIPFLLDFLAEFQGAKTKSQKVEFVQIWYFAFLFIQLFLVVSIASFFAVSLDQLLNNVKQLQTASDVLNMLATNLPKAANYFFSYMILQALSTSSATLLQGGAIFVWYVVARALDSTARDKWSRNARLSNVRWGAFFPMYTNFACIALVYCIIAPLISLFAVITFSLLWFAQRYAMLYVTRFEYDTGGVLYPRAINQTFTGVYVMELCISGLFFIVEDKDGKKTCTLHGIVMILVFLSTVIYQIVLNKILGPLFCHLPITFEDEAVLRDEAFKRAQSHRYADSDHEQGANTRSSWMSGQENMPQTTQRTMVEAFYTGIPDEMEDLTPDDRDLLTFYAFQHEALRAHRPTVWIPRDDLGISEDEIMRTRAYSWNISICNRGTALDSKGRVVYGGNPPDFSKMSLINL
ncbi:hypothetical protein EDB81DRAFT_673191 [Dactylonectria macrodidyma]|uniref:DUF221-domain-containing protein n=1 Tax=Dactylonectria macrodidyma TaxID=307937 RepID=A0A9P9CY10_9HYPO|nr:hypothetical protein EDB81DRAFT_673191 [Dactylonectria macrodidyma]